jgi:hypothetical protein
MVSVMDSIEYTLPVWMTALICILAVFSFVYYRYLCIYTLDEKMKDYGILVSMGYNQKRISEAFLWIMAKSMLRRLLPHHVFFTLVYQNIYSFYTEVPQEFILHQPVTDEL